MTQVLIFRARQPDVMRALIARAGTGPVRALNVDTDVLLDAWWPRLEFGRYGDVLDRQALDQVGVDSLALAQRWYRAGGTDPTLADGLSFGQYIDYEMKRVFTTVCRHVAYLDLVRPTRVLLADDGSLLCDVTLAWAEARGVTADSVPAQPISQPADWLLPAPGAGRTSARQWLRWLLWRISRTPVRGGRSGSLTLLVQPHQHTRALIEAILTRTSHRVVLPSHDRAYWRHPQAIVTDWQLAAAPNDMASSRSQTWRALEAALSPLEALSYRGVPLWRPIRRVARDYWDHAWGLFRRQALYTSVLFDRLHVDAVVVPQDQAGLEKALVMAARAHGVLSVCVAHGIPAIGYGGAPGVNSDMLVVWGREQGERWQRLAMVRRVEVTGSDDIGQLPQRVLGEDRRRLRAWIGLAGSAETVVLFAAQPYVNLCPIVEPSDENDILRVVCRVAGQLPDASLLIRVHPSTAAYESVNVKRAVVAASSRGNVTVDPGLTLEEALAISDVVLTADSTVGLEAIAAGKPLVVFDRYGMDAAGYVQGGAGMVASTEAELLAALRRITADPAARDEVRARGRRFLIRNVVGFGDGNAAARMLEAIEGACSDAAPSRADAGTAIHVGQ